MQVWSEKKIERIIQYKRMKIKLRNINQGPEIGCNVILLGGIFS